MRRDVERVRRGGSGDTHGGDKRHLAWVQLHAGGHGCQLDRQQSEHKVLSRRVAVCALASVVCLAAFISGWLFLSVGCDYACCVSGARLVVSCGLDSRRAPHSGIVVLRCGVLKKNTTSSREYACVRSS